MNVRISKKLYNFLTSQKRYHEPIDRIADRIFATTDAREAVEDYHDIQEIIENKDNIIKSLSEEVRILQLRLKEMRSVDKKLTQYFNDQ